MAQTKLTASCNHNYQLCQDVRKFVVDEIAPVISDVHDDKARSDWKRVRAIECVYTRILKWLVSLEKLNQTHDVQAIGTGARCIFEHYLDLRWFKQFPADDYLEKFVAFPIIDRYSAAKRVVDYKTGNPKSAIDVTAHQNLMKNLDSQKEPPTATVVRLWGTDKNGKPKWPRDHWTGEGNLRDRAKKLGIDCEDTYIQMYPVLCALVHPGAGPMMGDFEWQEKQVGYGYFYAFHHSWEATELVIGMLGIEARISKLNSFKLNLAQWLEDAASAAP